MHETATEYTWPTKPNQFGITRGCWHSVTHGHICHVHQRYRSQQIKQSEFSQKSTSLVLPFAQHSWKSHSIIPRPRQPGLHAQIGRSPEKQRRVFADPSRGACHGR